MPYLADGWGIGEVWLEGEQVLWHELPTVRPHPPKGGDGAPEVKLAEIVDRDRDESVPEVLRRLAAYFPR